MGYWHATLNVRSKYSCSV